MDRRACRTKTQFRIGQVLDTAAFRYYGYLNALEAALPIGRERGGVQITFQWGDAFQPKDRHSSSSVAFEKVCLHGRQAWG